MAIIDTLTVNLTAFTSGLAKGLKGAEALVSSFATRLESPLGRISALVGGAFSVNALKNFVAGGFEAADTISDIATELGITAEAFNQLRHAAVLSDVSQEQLIVGLEKMEKTIGEAAQGSNSAEKTFSRLGINFSEFRKLAPEKQFKVLATAIGGIQDPSERAAAAADVFGKSGVKLIPVLLQGEQGLERLGQEVEGAFSEENLKRFDEADNAFKAMSESMLSLKTEAALALAPTIVAITKEFEKWLELLKQIIEQLVPTTQGGGWGQGGPTPVGAGGRLGRQAANAWELLSAFSEAMAEDAANTLSGFKSTSPSEEAAWRRLRAANAVAELLENPQTASMSAQELDRITALLEKSITQQERLTEIERQQLELLKRSGLVEGVEL